MSYWLFMRIATAKAETIFRKMLRHTYPHPSIQPSTWQHDIKSLLHREQIDTSAVR